VDFTGSRVSIISAYDIDTASWENGFSMEVVLAHGSDVMDAANCVNALDMVAVVRADAHGGLASLIITGVT
jgi:hypothetical protein